MIAANLPRSSDVELWLHCGGKRYELRQAGGNFANLAKPEAIAGGEAVVETIVDGQSGYFSVGAIEDHSADAKRINFATSSV